MNPSHLLWYAGGAFSYAGYKSHDAGTIWIAIAAVGIAIWSAVREGEA